MKATVLMGLLLSGCIPFPLQGRSYLQEMRNLSKGLPSKVHPDPAGTVFAGTAKLDITPPAGIPLGGFARRRGKHSQGIHDPVFVRVLALKDANDWLILTSCDLIAINEPFFDAIYQKVHPEIDLGKEDLFLFASHTHSGPGAIARGILEQAILGKFNRKIFDQMTEAISGAIREASQNLEPVRLYYGTKDLEGWIENRMVEDLPVDQELKLLRVDDLKGRPKALLVNLTAHPTILGADNLLLSADYPGFLQAKMESQFPELVCLFANGAAGDQAIRAFPELHGFERAEQIGEGLAEEILTVWDSMKPLEEFEISSTGGLFPLPPVRIRLGSLPLPRWLGRLLLDRKAYFESARLGGILLIGFPGELASEIGLEMKKEAARRGQDALLIGYANDYLGYVIPERFYHTDVYEARASFYGPQMDAYVKEIILSQMDALSAEGREKQ